MKEQQYNLTIQYIYACHPYEIEISIVGISQYDAELTLANEMQDMHEQYEEVIDCEIANEITVDNETLGDRLREKISIIIDIAYQESLEEGGF